MKRHLLGGILLLSTAVALAQTPTYDVYAGWYKQWNDSLKGAHITAAQHYLQLRHAKLRQQVVVGIVDSGIDVDSRALKSVLWTNAKEKLNGRDDDGNGYVDDVHGWNFWYCPKKCVTIISHIFHFVQNYLLSFQHLH
ncbi:MAG: hypothetical protein ACFNOO_07545 [Segatella oulorum]